MVSTIEKTMTRMQSHLESVCPGEAFTLSDAADVGDGVWQGDLGIEIVAAVPDEYVQVKNPMAADKQLVPGNTQGSRHCLDSLRGVTIYRPAKWDAESLQGPCLVLAQARTITHPTHGDVIIPAGRTVLCRYQREFDAEQKRERRARD